METLTKKVVNVAPSSTHGHFVHEADQVINLDLVNETFLVKGKSLLTSSNHTNLETQEDCIITCQTVYDPFEGKFNKSKD